MRVVPVPPRRRADQPSRVALLTVHTSPLDQPGSGDGGGLNVYVREAARRMAGRGIEVDVFTRRSDPDAPEIVEVDGGVSVHHIDAGPTAPIDKAELPNYLCEFNLNLLRHPTAGTHDVVHAHYWMSGWVGRRVADSWEVPLVQTFHTLAAVKNATLAPGDTPEPALRLAAEQRIADRADRIAVLTCGEARILHRHFGVSGARLVVVPAGVDLDVFHPGAEVHADVRWPNASGPRLLFVGRLQSLKGPDVAIETLARVRQSHPDASLLVVGGPSGNGAGRTDIRDLERLATGLGVGDALSIVPARPQPELADLYRRADVLLVPSRSETFGLVALEAQAMGTPVVAANVGGLRAVVGGGTLVTGHDPDDHAAAVRRFLDDDDAYRDAAVAGRKMSNQSSWDRTVDRLLELYVEASLPMRTANAS